MQIDNIKVINQSEWQKLERNPILEVGSKKKTVECFQRHQMNRSLYELQANAKEIRLYFQNSCAVKLNDFNYYNFCKCALMAY